MIFSENFRTDLAASFFLTPEGMNAETLLPNESFSLVGLEKGPLGSGNVISTLARLFWALFKKVESRAKDCKTGSEEWFAQFAAGRKSTK